MTAHLKWRLGNRPDLRSATDEGVDLYSEWLNDAIQELAGKHYFWQIKFNWEFPALETDDSGSSGVTTSDGVAYVTSPTDALFVEYMWDVTNDKILDWVPFTEYLDYPNRANTSAEAKPDVFTTRGGLTYVYPTPDDEYNLYHYYRKIPDRITGSTENPLGGEWDVITMELATQKGFHYLRDEEGKEACKLEFLRMAAEQVGIYTRQERAGNKRTVMSHQFTSAYKPKS